jgi:hypothetical protein
MCPRARTHAPTALRTRCARPWDRCRRSLRNDQECRRSVLLDARVPACITAACPAPLGSHEFVSASTTLLHVFGCRTGGGRCLTLGIACVELRQWRSVECRMHPWGRRAREEGGQGLAGRVTVPVPSGPLMRLMLANLTPSALFRDSR